MFIINFSLFKSGIVNNGVSIKFENIYNYKKACKVFSEGDKNLENLLLTCFNNCIATVGCCRGHEDKKSKPYISFKLDDFNNYLFYILYSFCEEKGTVYLGRSNMSFEDYMFRDDFFKNMNDSLKKYNSNIDYYELLPFDLKAFLNMYLLFRSHDYLFDTFEKSFSMEYTKTFDNRYYYRFSITLDDINDIFLKNGFITLNGSFVVIDEDRNVIASNLNGVITDLNLYYFNKKNYKI